MIKLLAVATLSLIVNLTSAPVLADTGDPVKGKALYAVCSGCHGSDGMGNVALQAPRLAGQYDWYIATQLRNFREGLRGTVEGDAGGNMMRPMAFTLPDEQAILDVSAYLGSL